MSNDITHDNVMTFNIIKDIIETYPDVLANGKLILRSDNASTQYKSKYVFHDMKKLAQMYDIEVVWFHGEVGHGRGIVDSMSSFGCKAILRDAVVTGDLWFPDADKMWSYCKEHFKGDTAKCYRLINYESTALTRLKPRKEHKLPGCLRYHMIAVDQERRLYNMYCT